MKNAIILPAEGLSVFDYLIIGAMVLTVTAFGILIVKRLKPETVPVELPK